MSCPVQGGKIVQRMITIGGLGSVVYDVTLRIRGVLEPKTYAGGKPETNHFYVGGAPTASIYNTFSIAVSAPAQTYFLNYDEGQGESNRVFALDHTKVIQMIGGATITLAIGDPDCTMVRNCASLAGPCSPYVIPDVAPPASFDEQSVQIDVVSVTAAK
jgi:hypothetical protein